MTASQWVTGSLFLLLIGAGTALLATINRQPLGGCPMSPINPTRTPDQHLQEVRRTVDGLRGMFEPPYTDLLNLIDRHHEPGVCSTCDAFRVLAYENPPIAHEPIIQPGVSISLQLIYRAECECGWRGAWYGDRANAEQEASDHETAS